MAVLTPQDLHRRFAEAFNTGDLPALLTLYERHAVLVQQSGQPISGHEAIGAAMQQFFAMRGTIDMETLYVVAAGDTALLGGRWQLNGTGADGKPIEMRGKSIEVAKRQSDGGWRFVIDSPFGGE
jgi:uncharacterized protein (TIGR02246 family)